MSLSYHGPRQCNLRCTHTTEMAAMISLGNGLATSVEFSIRMRVSCPKALVFPRHPLFPNRAIPRGRTAVSSIDARPATLGFIIVGLEFIALHRRAHTLVLGLEAAARIDTIFDIAKPVRISFAS